jgi:hypothetical protein
MVRQIAGRHRPVKTPAPAVQFGAGAGGRIGQSGKAIRPHAKTPNTRRGPFVPEIPFATALSKTSRIFLAARSWRLNEKHPSDSSSTGTWCQARSCRRRHRFGETPAPTMC